ESGGRHRPGRVHLLVDRPMTATTRAPLTGPVSRIDPATAYHRPPSKPGALRLDSNEGVLPSRALLGDLANADPELLRRYPDVTALEAALATRLGVAPERLVVTAGADEAIDRACRAFLEPGRTILLADPSFDMFDCSARRAPHPRSRVRRVRGRGPHFRSARSSQRPGAAHALQGLGPRRLPRRLRRGESVRRRRPAGGGRS